MSPNAFLIVFLTAVELCGTKENTLDTQTINIYNFSSFHEI